MGKKSSPPPPDYTGAAEKQAAASQQNVTQQTWANRADQYNPWGSETWGTESVIDPATGQKVTKWTQNTTLDPMLQKSLDSEMAVQQARSGQAQDLIGRMQSEFGEQMDWSGLPQMQAGPQAGRLTPNSFGFGTPNLQTNLDFSGTQGVQGADQQRQRAEDAIYQSATSRLDPRFADQQRSLETSLANQGITRGSEAFAREMEKFGQTKNDAYQQAQMGAITGAGAEAQRNFGMDLGLRQQQVGEIGQQGEFRNDALGQGFGFGMANREQAFGQQQQAGSQNFQQQMQASQFQNQLRQQALTEQMQQRGFSLNEINALMSGQQVQSPQFAGYNQAGMAQTPDYMGALTGNYNSQMDAANAKSAGQAQTMQGVGAVASIAIMI